MNLGQGLGQTEADAEPGERSRPDIHSDERNFLPTDFRPRKEVANELGKNLPSARTKGNGDLEGFLRSKKPYPTDGARTFDGQDVHGRIISQAGSAVAERFPATLPLPPLHPPGFVLPTPLLRGIAYPAGGTAKDGPREIGAEMRAGRKKGGSRRRAEAQGRWAAFRGRKALERFLPPKTPSPSTPPPSAEEGGDRGRG